jgi:DNA-directed RNA polymerase subunit beta'
VCQKKRKRFLIRLDLKKERVIDAFEEGLISRDERRRMMVEVWHRAKTEIEKVLPDTLDENGSAYEMWKSGARGSLWTDCPDGWYERS